MNSNLHTVVLIATVIVFQLIINNFINPGPYLFICLVPFAISLVPRDLNINATMLVCFALGLAVDIFSRGVIGVNAAAATALSVLREPIYRFSINRNRQDNAPNPGIRQCGLSKYVLYISSATLVYMFIYCAAESLGVRDILFFLVQFILSSVLSVILSCCFSLTVRS